MSDRTLRTAVVEPYLGGSHRAWAEGYQRSSAHDVELFGLPPIHWKWRMQGGHVTLAPRIEAAVRSRGPFDALVASSMTDLAGLLGIARAPLAGARVVLYMHENQLTFPRSEHDREDLTYAMTNWTSMLAADTIVFNSEYHRAEWFDALPAFLGRLPDHRHTHLIDGVRGRSTVVPVGADLAVLDALPTERGDRPLILWNQRWEYDQGPDAFARAVAMLVEEGAEFEVALAGGRPGHDPPDLARLRARLGARLVHDGHADVATYRRLLRRADVVVSAAHHEFFGVAVTEAVYAGAFPVLPNRLVYPDRIPAEHRVACLYDDEAGLLARLRWAIEHRDRARAIATALRTSMAAYDWSVVATQLDEVVNRTGPDRGGRHGR